MQYIKTLTLDCKKIAKTRTECGREIVTLHDVKVDERLLSLFTFTEHERTSDSVEVMNAIIASETGCMWETSEDKILCPEI